MQKVIFIILSFNFILKNVFFFLIFTNTNMCYNDIFVIIKNVFYLFFQKKKKKSILKKNLCVETILFILKKLLNILYVYLNNIYIKFRKSQFWVQNEDLNF